eukprot:XP_011675260.1 PREDICTED: uncharacterized protein LOC105443602 [Strongylocentrotus purpuratus]
MHFSIASVVLLVCTITYRLLFKLDYVRSALPRGDDQAKAWDFSRKNLRNLWKIVKIRFPRMTCIAVIVRVIFILFIFCNYRPDQRTLPVWLKNDIAYAFFVEDFSLSNGYLRTTIVDDGIK